VLGSPLEYFSKGRLRDWQQKLEASDQAELFRRLFRRRTSPNGWFGVKAHWPQFVAIVENRSLYELFRFERFIHIERADRLAQAISWVIAQQSAAWISFHEAREEPTLRLRRDPQRPQRDRGANRHLETVLHLTKDSPVNGTSTNVARRMSGL
jgi:LPS sulfotransferase NodH